MPLQITKQRLRIMIADRFAQYINPITVPSIITWGQRFLPDYFKDEPSLMHEWIDESLQDANTNRGQNVIVVGPRAGAKTTIAVTTQVLKRICEGLETYIIIVSDTWEQANDNLRAIKDELIENEAIREVYPHACGRGMIWQKSFIKTKNGIAVHAFGTGSHIRGRKERENRPSLVIFDDPENDDHIVSALRRKRTRSWFFQTLMNIGTEQTNTVVLGTALHRECLVMTLLNKSGWKARRVANKPTPFRAIEQWPLRMDLWNEWEKIYLDNDCEDYAERAEAFYEKNKTEMDDGAVVLWPDRESLYSLMVKRADIGHQAFETERQGNPIDPETCEWPEEYFDHETFWVDAFPQNLLIKVIALDPSKGKDENRGDYSSIAQVAVSENGHVYVSMNMKRRTTDKIISDTVSCYREFEAESAAIETNQFQELLATEIETEADSQHVEMEIVQYDNRAKKTMRIRRLSALYAKRRIHFVGKSESNLICVQQHRDFPNGDHDDGPDSLEMAIRRAFSKLKYNENEQSDDGIGSHLGN